MAEIFSSTLPIFLITMLGSIVKHKWLTAEEFWRGLEKLSYFLLFPAVLFSYVSKADLGAGALTKLVFALVISTAIVSVGLIYYRKRTGIDRVQFTSIFQGAVRYNSYIFFGLSDALFGSEGLAIVAVISSYMIVFTNAISVMVFAGYIPENQNEGQDRLASLRLIVKLMITNPLIVASILGFLFNYSGLELSTGLQKTLSSLSDSALAIGMLNVGAGLKFVISSANIKLILFTSGIKLVAFPIITVIVLSIMSITGTTKAIGILYSCLPCASTAYVLSRQLGGDPDSMASIITFTTILSVISLSLLMYILT